MSAMKDLFMDIDYNAMAIIKKDFGLEMVLIAISHDLNNWGIEYVDEWLQDSNVDNEVYNMLCKVADLLTKVYTYRYFTYNDILKSIVYSYKEKDSKLYGLIRDMFINTID